MAVRVLLIDDSPFDRELVRHALRDLTTRYGPIKLLTAEDWTQGMTHLGSGAQDLLLLDFRLPGPNGLDILHQLRGRPHPPVIMLTGQDDIATAVETIRAGAYDYVPKSANWAPTLRLAIERVLERVHLERELAASRARLETCAAELDEKVAARTALVEAQAREIEATYLKAEEAPHIKVESIGSLTHDFGTPLNIAFGYLDFLRGLPQGDPAGEASGMLDKLEAQLERLHALVDTLRALKSQRPGSDSIVLSHVSLRELVEELRAEAAVQSAEKGLDLSWQAPAENDQVQTDREKLRAIAFHLLSNAIKSTPAGRIEVALARTPAGGIVLRISDTGMGVPAEARTAAFESFEQLEGSSPRRYEGVGLGLGIVKRYTALLRGSVRLTSAPGAGTTVLVELPDPSQVDSTDAAATRGDTAATRGKDAQRQTSSGTRDHAGQRPSAR